MGSLSGLSTKIPHARSQNQKKREKKHLTAFPPLPSQPLSCPCVVLPAVVPGEGSREGDVGIPCLPPDTTKSNGRGEKALENKAERQDTPGACHCRSGPAGVDRGATEPQVQTVGPACWPLRWQSFLEVNYLPAKQREPQQRQSRTKADYC